MNLKSDLVNQSVQFAAWNTTTGVPTTITSATAGLSLWYRRGINGAKTAISPVDLSLLTDAHSDGGILVIEGAEHRLDLPDAATVAGVLTVSWGGTATGITIDGGTATLTGQINSPSDISHVMGYTQTARDLGGILVSVSGSVGTPIALDGGTASLAGMLTKMADDSGGSVFDATNDSLNKIKASVVAGVATTLTASGNIQTTGSLIGGDYSSTYLSNGVYWITAPVTPGVVEDGITYGLNTSLEFGASASQTINSVTIRGYFNSAPARNCNIYAYNWGNSVWDQLSDSITRMNNATINQTYTYSLLSSHMKSDGSVRVGFKSTSVTTTDRLNIDQCIIAVATAGPTAADIADAVFMKTAVLNYEAGVWIDTIAGTSGTSISDQNGTSTKPCLYYSDAISVANNLGVKRFYLKPDSDITLTQNHDYWRFIGKGLIRLNNQSINDGRFEQCELITGSGLGDDVDFLECVVGDCVVGPSLFRECALIGSVTASTSGNYTMHHCYDHNPGVGATPKFVFASGVGLGMRDCQGGMELGNMNATTAAKIDGRGRIVILSDCTGGDITIRGDYPAPTDQVVGGFLGTINQGQRYGVDQIQASTSGVLLATIIEAVP